MDAETVGILIDVRDRGRAAFAETEAGLKVIKKAVQDFSEAQRNGLIDAAAYREALKMFRDNALEAGVSFEELSHATKEATRAIDRYRAAEAAGLPFDEAMTAAITQQAVAQEASSNFTIANKGAILGSIPTWLAWTLAIGGTLAVLAPFVALVGSAVVAVTSFVVAGGAALALLGGLAVGFGGLAVALLALANAESGGVFGRHIRRTFEGIGKALAPGAERVAAQLVHWFDLLAPTIDRFGVGIEKWFLRILPGAIRGISQVIKDLTPDFDKFGDFLAKSFGAGSKGMGQLFEQTIRGVVIPAVEGLITNLIRLKDWFIKELPTLGPIVQQIFGQLGTWIQQAADHWGDLTDFVENQWPTTVKNAQTSLQELNHWWQENGSSITTFIGYIVDGMSHFNDLIGALTKLTDFLNGVGLGPGVLLDDLNKIVGALEKVWGYVQSLQPGGNTGHGIVGGIAGALSPARGAGHFNVTNIINGASNPSRTAALVTRNLQKLGAV